MKGDLGAEYDHGLNFEVKRDKSIFPLRKGTTKLDRVKAVFFLGLNDRLSAGQNHLEKDGPWRGERKWPGHLFSHRLRH